MRSPVLESDVALRDGSTARVRPVRPADRAGLLALLTSLTPASRRLRFFSVGIDLAGAAKKMVQAAPPGHVGLVATVGLDERVVAHASYHAGPDGSAEVDWTVAEDQRGRGLATLLLGHLAHVARANGIDRLQARVLPDNEPMVEVLRDSGLPLRTWRTDELLHFEMPTALAEEAVARFELRERAAGAAAVAAVLSPRSVAVIGASRSRGTIGGEVFHNLVSTPFAGPVHPVNPNASMVQGTPAYASVTDIPGSVDLAVITVPAAAVVDAALACAAKGVRALVVISAGFAETDAAGRERQRRLVEVCRASGMRLIGPNCMGVINTAPDVRLNATFAPVFPPAGRIGFMSQSGALGLSIIDHARARGLGLSTFVSVGNKADLSGNDLLSYWETDPDTDVILLYLESFGNPRKFARISRRIARAKPIVAVKSGRSVAGARATSSHTGALVAASDVTVDALFRQTGVIRTETLAELMDVAALLAHQPVPAGPRVAMVTNAGGPAILCADACEARGLEVTTLADETVAKLRAFLPPEASAANPVDMIASASADDYRRAIETLAADEGVDAIVAIFIPPLVTRAHEVAAAIRDAAGSLPRSVPLLAVFMSASGLPAELRGPGVGVPSYPFPEDAARALAHAVRYGAWRAAPEGVRPAFADCERDEARAIVSAALARGGGWLAPDETFALLRSYGVPVVETHVAADAEAAARAAEAVGRPVALKAVARGLIHKTEAGAVRLSLEGSQAVRSAASEMAAALAAAGHRVDGFVVQRMAAPGVEMLVGVVQDPVFGPVVACGAGGTAVEVLKDVAVRLTPVTDRDAREMIASLRTHTLLAGHRGSPAADVAALEDVVLRVGALVEERPEIAELDCNPVVVTPEGALVVDARVRVAPPAPGEPVGAVSPAREPATARG